MSATSNISSSIKVGISPIECLYNNEKFSDIIFIVGKERQQILAHKNILSANSIFFEAMFYGFAATKADKIEVPDVEPAAFSRLLKFLYSNEVLICPETVMATLYVANKYHVPELVAFCSEMIDKNTVELLAVSSNISSSKIFKVDISPIECLYNNGKFSDIIFIVGKERQKILAHKNILSANSIFFEAMFYGFVATKADKIEVPDVEPAVFSRLLKFLYSNEVQICLETVMTTLYAANKYHVPELVAFCLEMVNKNTVELLATDSFTNIDLEVLILVLKRNTLQVTESKLFQALLLWSKVKCDKKKLPITPKNQRHVLGGALTLVQFSLMTLKEFVNGPILSGLLDDNEAIKFCKEIAASNTNSIEIPRCSKTSLECHLQFYYSNSNLISKQTCYTDCFKFIRPVVIVGLVINARIIKNNSNVVLTFIDEEDDAIRFRVSQSKNGSIICDMLSIMFDRPIMAIPDYGYKVEIQIEDLSGSKQNQRTAKGTICGHDGHKLKHLKSSDYFSFTSHSGILTEIIFFDSE